MVYVRSLLVLKRLIAEVVGVARSIIGQQESKGWVPTCARRRGQADRSTRTHLALRNK